MGIVSDRVNQFKQSAAVNSHLTWGDVSALKVGGRPVGSAFLDARMVLLPARTKLYKFNSYQSIRPDAAGNVTGWWSPYNAYDVDPGWIVKRNMAKTLGISIRELGRITSAITETWNSLEYLAVITLSVDIWVAYGRFAQQVRTDHNPKGKVPITHSTVGKAVFKPGVGEAQLPYRHIRPEGRGKGRNLPGGGRQFFVPNLKPTYYTGFSSQSLLYL